MYVVFDSMFGDRKLKGDLAVCQFPSDQVRHLPLTAGERVLRRLIGRLLLRSYNLIRSRSPRAQRVLDGLLERHGPTLGPGCLPSRVVELGASGGEVGLEVGAFAGRQTRTHGFVQRVGRSAQPCGAD